MAIHDIGLHRSVREQLRANETPDQIVYMSTRHRLWLPFCVAAFGAFVALGTVLEFEGWPSRIALGGVGAAIGILATTEYRVLASTEKHVILLRASRIRKRAVEVMSRLPLTVEMELMASNLVNAEYKVDGRIYTVLYRYRSQMDAIVSR